MEKQNVVGVAASDGVHESEAPMIAAVGAQAPVIGVAGVQVPFPVPAAGGWDTYEEEPYVAPPNLYDMNIVDDLPEVESDDVGSDDESFHTKACHILRRLQSGKLDACWARDVCRCPFCKRSIATDFNSVMRHAETVGSTNPKVGQTFNKYAFMAKHKALGIHLRHLRNLAIEKGEIAPPKPKPPKVQGLGSKKERKRQLEAVAAMMWG